MKYKRRAKKGHIPADKRCQLFGPHEGLKLFVTQGTIKRVRESGPFGSFSSLHSEICQHLMNHVGSDYSIDVVRTKDSTVIKQSLLEAR